MVESEEELLEDLLTVRDWIRWGASRFEEAGLFYGHGTDNAWDEAAQILLWVVHTPWDKLPHIVEARLTTSEKLRLLQSFLRRINERVPASYITGTAYFAGMPFHVTPDTLVPRSPIAELIGDGFQPWLTSAPARILDLCTGGGCIGIACAVYFEEALVDLSDISEAALAVAARNVSLHKVEDRCRLVHSDLFAELPGRYDLIVSNPPYVDAQDMASLPEEYRMEPTIALASGDDGLDFTRRLLREAAGRLTDEGCLIVEVGNSAEALERAFPQVPFTWIEFEHGGHGVFFLTREQLVNCAESVSAGA